MTEYADDHVPANPKPAPLALVTLPEPAAPSRARLMAAATAVMRSYPKRERFAKAHKLMNYALVLERFADEGDEERAALLLAAAELRALAEALKE